ncbi:HAD family hydrolase [Mumia zhuanghuii]|uniref:HAD family hydrolase n=2 Tax=Mumia TaxID=1546255 RepID=A0ABW1QHY5_9ACTN|nr:MULTISPECIES: HAD family hydrolase [Mumia]KAA1422595.1 HAD family hydrolase [Mumia zhuanghuii]
MTTAPTDTRAPHDRRTRLAVHRPSASPAARMALGAVAVVAVGVVLLCSTPVVRFPSWREVVVAAGSAVSLWCVWSLRAELTGEVRHRRVGLVTLSLVAVVVASAWSIGALAAGGPTLDLGVAAVVGVVILACHGIRREAAVGPTPVPRWFVPAALAVAVATVGVWIAIDARPTRALAAGVAVTIAACPGAVGLALPAAYRFGTRRGDALGVAIDDAATLAVSQRIDTLVLDGLRTFATGKRVASVDPVHSDHERNIRWFAGALEHASDNPVGKAIAKLSARGRLSGVRTHPGLGMSGSVDRHPVRVGRPDWVGIDATERVGITVGVEVDARPLGTITVVDAVRPTSAPAVAALRTLGVDPVLVTTADPLTAKDLAEQLGIDRVVAEAGPTTTADLVSDLRNEGRAVALLADAPEDAESSSVELVLAVGDPPAPVTVTLAEGDVAEAVTALSLARTIDTQSRSTLRVATAYTAGAVAVAAVGLLPPMGASLALAASSLIVLASAARLRRFSV